MAGRRPLLLIGWAVLAFVLWQFAVGPRLPHSWLSYSTRPLWDHSEAPKAVISHFDQPLDARGRNDTESWCSLHGWAARSERTEVWDATIFSTEIDLLLLRLHELAPVVSKFFLVESTRSFTGIPRPLALKAALDSDPRFAPFLGQIEYSLHEGRDLRPSESPFAQEIEVRQAMDALLKDSLRRQPAGSPVPVMIFGDVDELPSRGTAALLQACSFAGAGEGPHKAVHLGMREFLYSYAWHVGGEGAERASWRATANEWSERGRGEGEFYRHGKVTERVLADSGWHCSWCFRTLKEFETKALGYSHVDRLGSRPAALLRPARLQKTICDGTDIFRMLPEAYTYRDLISKLSLIPSNSAADVPIYLREHPDRMRYLLPGGCVREDYDEKE